MRPRGALPRAITNAATAAIFLLAPASVTAQVGDAEHASCDPVACVRWTLQPDCPYQTVTVPEGDPDTALRSAEDIAAEIPDLVAVTKQFFRPGGCRSYTFHVADGSCTTTPEGCAAPEPGADACGSSCFCVEPGMGLQLERNGDRPFMLFGSDARSGLTVYPDYWVLLGTGYTSRIERASQLYWRLGGRKVVAHVSRFNCDGTFTTWFPGAGPTSNFPVVPGEAYYVGVLEPTVLPLIRGNHDLGPQCGNNEIVLQGPASGLEYSWGVDLSYDVPYGQPVAFEASNLSAPGLPPGSAGFEMSQAFVEELRRANHTGLWAQVDRNDPTGETICILGRTQDPVLWVGGAGADPDCDVNDAGPCFFDAEATLGPMPRARVLPLLNELTWLNSGTYFDVVRGDLDTLRLTGGDFRKATDLCIADDYTEGSIPYPMPNPEPGTDVWYLVRDFSAYADHGYDGTSPGQVAPRDALFSAPLGCPP